MYILIHANTTMKSLCKHTMEQGFFLVQVLHIILPIICDPLEEKSQIVISPCN
jgi:hypothetical protein